MTGTGRGPRGPYTHPEAEPVVAARLAKQDVVQGLGHVLCRLVPMDEATAWAEAVFCLGNPGQGLSYRTGKLQLLELLAEAAGRDGFELKDFHDRLWREGNAPFTLQRWELPGLRDQLDAADRLAGATGD
ncbi:DUF885 family protein [Streptomyces sp. NPDC004728]|uniref:DUF885 family protein n=1 Tax=Streptomyces sp. NPDC004728 TaxID=3154289 RepID=UPI0033B65089